MLKNPGGDSVVPGPTRHFSGSIKMDSSVFQEEYVGASGSADFTYDYRIRPINFSLNANVPSVASVSVSKPTKRVIDAYVHRRFYSDGVSEHPDYSNWEGSGAFDLKALLDDQTPVFNPQTYLWNVSPEVDAPFSTLSDYDSDFLFPDVSTTHTKTFTGTLGQALFQKAFLGKVL